MICGIYVISMSANRNITINGIAFFAILVIGIFVSEFATNRLVPMGGVTNPMARFTVITTPKWIGSTPYYCTMGSMIGARIRIQGTVSMIIPANSRNRLITRRTTILLSTWPTT